MPTRTPPPEPTPVYGTGFCSAKADEVVPRCAQGGRPDPPSGRDVPGQPGDRRIGVTDHRPRDHVMTAQAAAAGERAHGTRPRYVLGPGPRQGPGCRCEPCRAANRAAENQRTRLIAYGRWHPYVDAGPAREHVRKLAAQGIGWKRTAALAGVSTSVVSKLLYGGPGSRPPSQRIRPASAAAILAVQPGIENLGPGALVPSTGTHRRIQALVANGWSQAKIGGRLGMTSANFAAMMRREHVTAATERAARDLYDEIWDKAPPENGQREKIAAARARNYAREHGWAPPLAWDDDLIDRPDAAPAEGWQRPARQSRPAAELAEDAWQLAAQGYSRKHAAARLGVSRSALGCAPNGAREEPAREQLEAAS
jgi:transcriptional regulator with XRE-family HTH domain